MPNEVPMRVGDIVRVCDLPAGANFRFSQGGGIFWRVDNAINPDDGLCAIGFNESNKTIQKPFFDGSLAEGLTLTDSKSQVIIAGLPKEYRDAKRKAKMARSLIADKSQEIKHLTALIDQLQRQVQFHKTTAEESDAIINKIDKVLEDIPGENFDTAILRVQAERDEARALNQKSDQLLADIVNTWIEWFENPACERCWRPAFSEAKGKHLCDACIDPWGEDYEGELP